MQKTTTTADEKTLKRKMLMMTKRLVTMTTTADEKTLNMKMLM